MLSHFLGSVLGWYLVIFSLFLLLRESHARLVMGEVVSNSGLFFILALITVIMGLLMVVSHNVWVMQWPVVITLLGWLVLLTGLVRLFFPEVALRGWHALMNHPYALKVTAVILLILGLWLLYYTYYLEF